ncbi:MAG: NAD(P)/FAD-dependent oxidoreductase [Dehalococcoidia bacterium]|nr:MAG: NAD(P)/FAD-dependent oxidoreductase [Dehalococcoidia bacterium]
MGGGPAGCCAAFFSKLLDKDNKREVVLLERLADRKFSQYHDMCGEGVNEDLFSDISPIKSSCILEKIRKVREYWPGDIEIETSMDGYIIDRPLFLNGIIDQYVKIGGQYIQNSLVDFVNKEGEIKVKLSDGGFVKTKYLIAADGANSLIRKKLGIKGRIKPFIQYVVDEEPEHDTLTFEYDEKWKGDYKWVFPHGETTKVGLPFLKYSDREKIEGKILAKQTRMIGFGGIENNVHGNTLLVGDAACHSNAITKGGIRPGMVSGKMAAEAVINDNPLEYDEKWKKSGFSSLIFLQAFNSLNEMDNRELARHMKPFRKGFSFFSTIKSLLFYREYLEIYKAYDLSNRVGW